MKLIRIASLSFLLTIVFVPHILSFDGDSFLTDYFWSRYTQVSSTQRPTIALVLSGGGARGYAHIGVLKVLEQEKIPIDMVVGTSVGALIGALYAAGVPVEKIEHIGEKTGWDDLADISEVGMLRLLMADRLLSTEKMQKYLEENLGNKRFYELEKTFACTATDLITGERIVFREGFVAHAARASATVPGLFEPIEYRHRYLIDGGLSGNIPTDVAQLLGADIIIAVEVSADFSKNDITNVFMTLTQSLYIQGSRLDRHNLALADFLIEPKVGNISAVDLAKSKQVIQSGIIAARLQVQAIKNALLKKASENVLFEGSKDHEK